MRALKVLVIVMGVLIVAGTAVVIVTVAKRVSQAGRTAPVAASLTLPAGCSVAEMTTIGDRLALRLEGAGDCRQILLVDPATGSITGHIGLVPAH